MFFAEFSDYRRVQLVFGDLNSFMQTFRRIGRQNGYLSLRDNLPVIDLFIEIVHSAASHLPEILAEAMDEC